MAAVAEAINYENFAVDIFAAGPEMYVFRSPAGQGRLDAVLEILAGVDVCPPEPVRAPDAGGSSRTSNRSRRSSASSARLGRVPPAVRGEGRGGGLRDAGHSRPQQAANRTAAGPGVLLTGRPRGGFPRQMCGVL